MSGSGNEVDQLLVAMQQALDATGLYVAPGMRPDVGPDEVAAIEAAIARSPEAVFVVVHPFTYDDAFSGNPGDLLSRLHDASDEPGLYVAGAPSYIDGEFALEARIWDDGTGGSTFETYAVTAVGEEQGLDDLGAQLVAATEAVADGTLDEQFAALTDRPTSSTSGSAAPDDDGGSAAPYVVGGGVVLTLVLLWALARRRPARTPAHAAPFTLPASVIDRVRDAHDAQLTRRAHDAVLALGERIDATEMEADAPQSWQAALDHYEAARRVLGEGDADVDVLDVVGAIVLAERGGEALEAATSGRTFEPTTRCFLDPLHGAATTEASIERRGGRSTVPLCAGCRADLRKKRRPDILDVVRDGEAVHYFETDDEPWASTGYGSLAPDLVERLHRQG